MVIWSWSFGLLTVSFIVHTRRLKGIPEQSTSKFSYALAVQLIFVDSGLSTNTLNLCLCMRYSLYTDEKDDPYNEVFA